MVPRLFTIFKCYVIFWDRCRTKIYISSICTKKERSISEKDREVLMKESIYKSYDELPLFLNAETVAKVLGVSPSSGYELLHEKNFPALKIGSRIVVPKEKFIMWVEQNTGGAI
jgi:excisionase family DNA binding protein